MNRTVTIPASFADHFIRSMERAAEVTRDDINWQIDACPAKGTAFYNIRIQDIQAAEKYYNEIRDTISSVKSQIIDMK